LAYTTILSFIPLLAMSFALFHTFGGIQNLMNNLRTLLLENLAQNTSRQAIDAIDGFVSNLNIRSIGIGGLIGLLITSFSLFSSAEKALLALFREKVERSFFSRISAYWLFITLGPLLFAVVIGVISSRNQYFSIPLPPNGLQLFLGFLFFSSVFRFLPQTKPKLVDAIIGSLVTTLLWVIAKIGFAIYVKKFLHYDKIYGAISALPVMLIWIWLIWVTVLTGASVTAFLRGQRNST
jgi:membrane protein